MPLLSVIQDSGAQQALRQLMHDYHRELVADRGLDVEAQVLAVLRELQASQDHAEVSIREITDRLAQLHGEELDRKITPRWVGYIVHHKLGIKTYRRAGSYFITGSERNKLEAVFERYGLLTEEPEARTSGLQGLRDDGDPRNRDAKMGLDSATFF